MSYARFWPRNWPGGIDAFYNFEGDTIPAETIELMKESYYFEMIQFPVHHNVIGNLWLDAWDDKGRYAKFRYQLYENSFQNWYIKTITDAFLNLPYFRAEDAVTLLTDVEEDYQMSYLFLGEAANQVFRFLQKATGNIDYLYWLYGMLTAWDSSIGMLHLEE